MDDLGQVMLNVVHQHADPHLTKDRGRFVDFNAWWRGGDSSKVRLYVQQGCYVDIVTQEKGIARDLAQHLGLTLKEMVSRYGDHHNPVAPPPVKARVIDAPDPDPIWRRDDASILWDLHRDQEGEQKEELRTWLRDFRGLPRIPPSGILVANPDLFPDNLDPKLSARDWARRILSFGPCALVPMRTLTGERAGMVDGLVLRPFIPKKLKSISVKGLHRGPGESPVVFGARPLRQGKKGHKTSLIVLCEGAPDTWTAELLLENTEGEPVVVIGVNGAGMLPKIAQTLSKAHRRWRVVVVVQKDEPNKMGVRVGEDRSRAAIEIFHEHGVTARALHWPPMNRLKDLNDVVKEGRKSWEFLSVDFAEHCAWNV